MRVSYHICTLSIPHLHCILYIYDQKIESIMCVICLFFLVEAVISMIHTIDFFSDVATSYDDMSMAQSECEMKNDIKRE